jgi:flagellar hook protein FlgE
MGFQTGLSGLNASSKNLDVIGNNIANANTVGMKTSRAEFADIVASSISAGGGGNNAGIGVTVAAITQQFAQGNVTITGNSLDVAINGGGFFQVTKTDGSTAYTRDGQFKLDKEGNLITNTGAALMGYATDAVGEAIGTSPQALTLPTTAPIDAKPTALVTAEFNLDARAKDSAQAIAAGQTADPRSKYGTSITVFDQQGVPTAVSLYFEKTVGTPNTWDVYPDTNLASAALGQITFDTTGKISGPLLGGIGPDFGLSFPAGTIVSDNPNESTGFLPQAIDVNLNGATQYGVTFAVSNLSQDGYTSGEFTGLNIDEKGVITTSYSNGQTLKTGGMIALADFRNVQGLAAIGAGEYLETFASGPTVLGKPTVGRFGELRSGAVEESNVDLTAELVNMMTAQRNYQANAQTIKTQDQVMSTLVNLR